MAEGKWVFQGKRPQDPSLCPVFVLLMFTLLSLSSTYGLYYYQPVPGSTWLVIFYTLFVAFFWGLILVSLVIEHRSQLGQEKPRPDSGDKWWSEQDKVFTKKVATA